MKNFTLIKHPLITTKLSYLRNKLTKSKDFREILDEISMLMAYEVLKDIELEEIEIETPVAKTIGYELKQKVNLYPILRAGMGMLDGFQAIVPNARVGHIGLYRDEETLKPVRYLFKYPKDTQKDTYNILIDPMLATGGSAVEALNMVKEEGITNIKFVGLLASREALELINKHHPDVEIFIASVEKELNSNGYLVPGLGDAGDRIFGTK